ncbi:MAG: chemotaxis protein CheW [Peptococcaceae bacterium]
MAEQQIVIFKLDGVEYGIDILQVNEIVKLQAITKMPNMPDYVDGVINLRGKVIPIVDLKVKFKLNPGARNENTRIIVVNVDHKVLGAVVDEVSEVLRIKESQIEDANTISTHINEQFVRGVAKVEDRLVILLKIDEIF